MHREVYLAGRGWMWCRLLCASVQWGYAIVELGDGNGGVAQLRVDVRRIRERGAHSLTKMRETT